MKPLRADWLLPGMLAISMSAHAAAIFALPAPGASAGVPGSARSADRQPIEIALHSAPVTNSSTEQVQDRATPVRALEPPRPPASALLPAQPNRTQLAQNQKTLPPMPDAPRGKSARALPALQSLQSAAVPESRVQQQASTAARLLRDLPAAPIAPPPQAAHTGRSSAVDAAPLRQFGTDSAPRYRERRMPAYPLIARKRGWQGTVVIEATIDAQGRADTADVIESSGYAALDRSALDAIGNSTYHPAISGQEQIASRVRIPVVFRLH